MNYCYNCKTKKGELLDVWRSRVASKDGKTIIGWASKICLPCLKLVDPYLYEQYYINKEEEYLK